jgi:dipeptidyl aminopeptidase/acylaminoacyl peptidase
MFKPLTALAFSLIIASSFAFGQKHVPTVDDLLNVKGIGAVLISPDGKWIAYGVSEPDWKQDAIITQLWLIDTFGGKPFQLTRGEKSAGSIGWAPNSEYLTFVSSRIGDKSQLFAIRPNGGEAVQLTKADNGINGYEWSPDGNTIAYTTSNADSKISKERQDYLGGFEIPGKEYSFMQLWTINFAEALNSPSAGTQITKNKEFTIGAFEWSPDGARIAFSGTSNSDAINSATADIYVLTTADKAIKKIVSQPGPDNGPHWSPDGRQIVFSSSMGNPKFFHSNNRLAVVPAEGGEPRSLTDAFDEQPGFVKWNKEGIYFNATQTTALHLFRLDPSSGKIIRFTSPENVMATAFSFSADGKKLALVTFSPTEFTEIQVTPVDRFAPRKLTNMSDQIKDFTLGMREVISWKSKDGAVIEGILIKPSDFDPNKKYPLLCVIHGGPTGTDLPTPIDRSSYPSDIWAAKGALVLKVNYRGSAGYGEKFRQLNVRNLGVGDAWDVLSGVDYLIGKGWVDPKNVGCMGWSQGGYISAFLTTSTDRFKAISVGAGISNWATYYYNTDITPFTIQYLGDDPANDPEIYAKTSPMTYIKNAKTPTLIQHGEFDRRVPIANAYELRQGLEDRGVPVEMVVYKGFGHGVNKPKSMRAVMTHNLQWFNHYLFGEPLPDFSKPVIPKKPEDNAAKSN